MYIYKTRQVQFCRTAIMENSTVFEKVETNHFKFPRYIFPRYIQMAQLFYLLILQDQENLGLSLLTDCRPMCPRLQAEVHISYQCSVLYWCHTCTCTFQQWRFVKALLEIFTQFPLQKCQFFVWQNQHHNAAGLKPETSDIGGSESAPS